MGKNPSSLRVYHSNFRAVVYTADLRRHGPRKDLTEEFIKKAEDAEPVALITEGTKMADVWNYSRLWIRISRSYVTSL